MPSFVLPPMPFRRRVIALVLAFFALYLITYSANVESGDANLLFDAVSSVVDHGDLRLDLAAWRRPPNTFANALPLQSADLEPLPILLAVPLYALAKNIPSIGLVHTVYLFNAIIAALGVGAMAVYARALGFRSATAITAGALLGAATLLWPYSKTLFREPLLLLCLLLAAIAIERLRARRFRSLVWTITVAGSLLLLLLTKSSAVLALPGLVILGMPTPLRPIDRRILAGSLLLIGVVVGVFLLLGALNLIPGVTARYNAINRLLEASTDYAPAALGAYLLYPGGSLWGTSPILLLAIPGAWISIRARRYRLPLAALVLTITFAIGYAVLNGASWFGGLSWPPRFLVPIVPIVLAAALPAIDAMISRPRLLLAAAPLIAWSVWTQWAGVSLWWGYYGEALPLESNGFLEWPRGMIDPRWWRAVVIPQLWSRQPLDAAWSVIAQPGWAVAFGALGLMAALAVVRRMPRAWLVGIAAALVVVVSAYLVTLYPADARYRGSDDAIRAMWTLIEDETHDGEILLLSNPRYEPFFANAGKWTDAARVITLPQQPGERPSEAQPARVTSANPADLLDPYTLGLILRLATANDRLWLLVDAGPDLPWSTRPVERYLSASYYPIRTLQTGSLTRLIEYDTTIAPTSHDFRAASIATPYRFGAAIRLRGIELPAGTRFAAGAAIPISLEWVTEAPLEAIVTAAVYLRAPDGTSIAQHDAPAGGGFAPSNGWRPDAPVWDHRGVRIPAGTPPGDYPLWVKVYDLGADGAPRDYPVTAGDAIDGTIGVLPVLITVE